MKLDRMKMEHQLKDAGVPDVQATAHAKVYGEMQEELATKDDIVTVRADIDSVKGDIVAVKADIAAVKSDVDGLKTDVADLKADVVAVKAETVALRTRVDDVQSNLEKSIDATRAYLEGLISKTMGNAIKWVIGMQFATVGIILTAMGFFFS